MADPLYSRDEIRRIFERGLLAGLWSVHDITKGSLNPVLPSLEFLEAHPRFKDRYYRDLDTYRRQRNQPTTTEETP